MTEVLGPHDERIHWWQRLICWVAESRAHRVICLVIGIWLLNAFDLALTLMADQHGLLYEENPVARQMLAYGPLSIVLYKAGMVMIGSYPLLKFRKVRITELGAFVVLFAYAILAVHWQECVDLYAMTASDSYSLAEIEMMRSWGTH